MKEDNVISTPFIINFQEKGNPSEGFLSIASVGDEVPFEVLRVFMTHSTPSEVIRGRHAHYNTEMVLICVQGKIKVKLEELDGTTSYYTLQSCTEALFIPKLCWHSMEYNESSIQLVMCSTLYNENDYIRDYKVFKDLRYRLMKK